MRWWHRLGLRARLIVVGTGGLAVAFALGGAILIGSLGLALQHSVDEEALATARDVAALVDARALAEPVPVAGGQLVQVVDAHGRVRAASIGADRLVPLLHPDELTAAVGGSRLYLRGEERYGAYGGPLRVVAVAAGPADDRQSVIVARPVGELLQSVALLRTALLVAYPLLLAALAALAWRVVGAALRPVEALRAVRRGPEESDAVVISAADPLNLVGILLPGARISPFSELAVAHRNGVPVDSGPLGALLSRLQKTPRSPVRPTLPA